MDSPSCPATPALTDAERADLLASVDRFICKTVRDAKFRACDVDDAVQSCRLEVWKASSRYDPARGIKVITFTSGVLRRYIATLREEANGNSVTLVNAGRALEVPTLDGDPAQEGEESNGERSAILADIGAAEMLAALTPSQQEIFRLMVGERLAAVEVAERLGRKLSLVDITLRQIVQRLVDSGRVPAELLDKLQEWRRLDAIQPARPSRHSARGKPATADKPAGYVKPLAKLAK